MTWDVFLSYAKEDHKFASLLAQNLTEMGLRVWFDDFELPPGGSLRKLIDRGLSQSRFGCVILSKAFFSKDWPQRELAALLARESQDLDVIIPIWYDVDVADITKYSPLLADKISLLFKKGSEDQLGDATRSLCQKIVQVVYKDKIANHAWKAETITLSDGSSVGLLPIFPNNGLAVGLAKYPVTNMDYSKFVKETGHTPPIGERFVDGIWSGPFMPQDTPAFMHPRQPVVCVGLTDCYKYCHWLTEKVFEHEHRYWTRQKVLLPDRDIWLTAATGLVPSIEMLEYTASDLARSFVHKRSSPATVDDEINQISPVGVAGLVGNIWEWCVGEYYRYRQLTIGTPWSTSFSSEIRGGSFVDDISQSKLQLNGGMLADGGRTRHSDLGFRVAVVFSLDLLSETQRLQLLAAPRYPSSFWLNVSEGHGYAWHY